VTRPTRDESMMALARVIAARSTCPRRGVGAVLTDVNGRVLAVAHNGVAMGEPHCVDHPCGGEGLASGTGLDACAACHAEVNGLLFCADVMRIDTLYVTASPCKLCVRYLLNSSCRRIVHGGVYDPAALDRWLAAGRSAVELKEFN